MWLWIILTMHCLTSLPEFPIFLIWPEFGSFPLFLTQTLVSICPYLCSIFIFFSVLSLYFFSYIIEIFFFFTQYFCSAFWVFFYLFTYDLGLMQEHLTFLSSNVHGMLSYKLALGTKGRPKFKTRDSFWGQWSFVHLPYVLRDIRKELPKKTAGFSQLGKREE